MLRCHILLALENASTQFSLSSSIVQFCHKKKVKLPQCSVSSLFHKRPSANSNLKVQTYNLILKKLNGKLNFVKICSNSCQYDIDISFVLVHQRLVSAQNSFLYLQHALSYIYFKKKDTYRVFFHCIRPKDCGWLRGCFLFGTETEGGQ